MRYHILNGGVGTYLLIHKVLSFVLVLAFNLPYFTFSSFCFFSENLFSFFWKWKWKYPTLCNPMDCIVHEILQARTLKWVAFPFSRASSKPRDWTQVSQHCRQILYQLSHKGSPRILEWVAYPSSSGSSRPRNRIGVSCIAGRFFTNWVIGELALTSGNCFKLSKTRILIWKMGFIV